MEIEITTDVYFQVGNVKPNGEILGTLVQGETAVTTPNVTAYTQPFDCDSLTFDEDGIHTVSTDEDGNETEATVAWDTVKPDIVTAFSGNFE